MLKWRYIQWPLGFTVLSLYQHSSAVPIFRVPPFQRHFSASRPLRSTPRPTASLSVCHKYNTVLSRTLFSYLISCVREFTINRNSLEGRNCDTISHRKLVCHKSHTGISVYDHMVTLTLSSQPILVLRCIQNQEAKLIRKMGTRNAVKHLAANDVYIRRTAQLTSRRWILNIYSTNILTEYFNL